MITSRVADPRGPAELADQDHQCAFQQAARAEIFKQCGDCLVHARQSPTQAICTLAEDAAQPDTRAMHVPGLHIAELLARRCAGPGGHTHQAYAGLDESARHEQILTERMPAVAVAQYCRFLL